MSKNNKKRHNKVYYIEQRRKKNKKILKEQKKNEVKSTYGFEYITKLKNSTTTEQVSTTPKKKSLFKKFKFETLLFSTISSLIFTMSPLTSRAFAENNYIEAEQSDEINKELDEVLENNNVTVEYESNSNNTYEDISYEAEQEILEAQEELRQKELEKQQRLEEERIAEYDYYVSIYATYFNLDSNKVLDICHDLYNNYEYFEGELDFENKEYFAMNFVYSLYHNDYESIGYSRNDLMIDNNVITLNEDKVLSNGYSYEDYLCHVSNMVGVNPDLVLAISNYETGYQKSNLAQTQNNFGGINFSNGYATFPTPEAGIIYQAYTVKNIIDNYEIDNLTDLSAVYVNGNIDKPSELWEDSVECIYYNISDNKELTLKK